MNRLQKKCIFATAGVHLLLLVILLVGPAFFRPRPKPDDSNLIDVIPANLVDAAMNSGVRNAQPPPPTPVATPSPPQPQPQPVQPPPKPVEPAPSFVRNLEKMFKPEPVKPEVKPDLTPVEKPARTEPHKTERHKIEINTKLVSRETARNPASTPKRSVNNDPRRSTALRSAIQSLRKDFSPSTAVDMPGNSTAASANYASVIVSIYQHAWVPPDGMENDNAIVRFTVTIANDGTVISAHIIGPSGDASIDAAVRRVLERVRMIAPFPDAWTEKERTFTLNFNATRRTLE